MALATFVLSTTQPLAAQGVAAAPLLDALSITVQLDSATVARGSLRLRQMRTGNDLELVANGTLVRKGLRITAELRTDSLFGLRRYTANTITEIGNMSGDRLRYKTAAPCATAASPQSTHLVRGAPREAWRG